MSRRRVTVTLDEELLEVGATAVKDHRAASMSAWINDALALKVEHERRIGALARAVADYESEFGEISDDELATQARADRDAAAAVRARRTASGAA